MVSKVSEGSREVHSVPEPMPSSSPIPPALMCDLGRGGAPAGGCVVGSALWPRGLDHVCSGIVTPARGSHVMGPNDRKTPCEYH